MIHYDNGLTLLNDWTAVRVTLGKGSFNRNVNTGAHLLISDTYHNENI